MVYIDYRKINTDRAPTTTSLDWSLLSWPSKQDLSGKFTDLKTERIVRNAEAKQRFQKGKGRL